MTTVSEDQSAVVAEEEQPASAPPASAPAEDTPKTPGSVKKDKSKKKEKTSATKFAGAGVSFRGKLIGIDDVPEPRGDIMCQQSMQKLKAGVRQAGQHKQKVLVNVSLVGIQIIDANSMAPCHRHPVHRISFISRDVTDTRAFGYIFGEADGKHKFFAIKTEKAAEQLVLALRDLFQCVFELKKKEIEEAKQKQEEGVTENGTAENRESTYDTPSNNAPVTEGTGDAVYEVPSNNGPVEGQSGGGGGGTANLLDLQSELNTLQQGIAQMDAFGDSFFSAPTSPPATDPWGNTVQSPPPAAPVASSAPVNAPFTATFPSTAPPVQAAAGFNAFGAPSQPFAGAPQAGQAMFTPDPFNTTPTAAPTDKYAVFASAQPPPPQPAPIDPFASVPAENLLQPVQLQSPQDEQQGKSEPTDLFGDLCAIGPSRPAASDPFVKRDPFKEIQAATPKKSLNELRNPNGSVANVLVATPDSDPFSLPPSMASSQPPTNPFGAAPAPVVPASDPFAQFADSQMSSAPAAPSGNDPFADFLTKPQGASDDFNMPFPNTPPPPVPVNNQLDLFNTAPAMPPRPTAGPTAGGLLQGPPTAKPRQATGEAPVPRPRTNVRQNGQAAGGDPFNVFNTPAQTSNPFGGASQTEEPIYAVVNKPKKN